MHRMLEARSFYLQTNPITFVLGTILLTTVWGAITATVATIGPTPAYSITPKQTRPTQIRITTPSAAPLPTGSLTGSLLPGGRVVYNLLGTARQNLTISLASEQLNAIFTLIAPDGTILASSRTGWIGSLQTTGNYQIIVSNTSSATISNYSIRFI